MEIKKTGGRGVAPKVYRFISDGSVIENDAINALTELLEQVLGAAPDGDLVCGCIVDHKKALYRNYVAVPRHEWEQRLADFAASEMGKKGGKATSPAKTKAARKNWEKALEGKKAKGLKDV